MNHSLPRRFAIAWSVFVAVWFPVYLVELPPVNFLWFSNIAVLGGLVAAWAGCRRLASMLLVAVGLLEMGWIFDFLVGLMLGGQPPLGGVGYMFDAEVPLYLRTLSLHHLALPFVLLWMVWRLGYDPAAFRWWLPVGWMVVLLTRWLVEPDENVNWVLRSPWHAADQVAGWPWLVTLMVALTAVWWLTHRLLCLVPVMHSGEAEDNDDQQNSGLT